MGARVSVDVCVEMADLLVPTKEEQRLRVEAEPPLRLSSKRGGQRIRAEEAADSLPCDAACFPAAALHTPSTPSHPILTPLIPHFSQFGSKLVTPLRNYSPPSSRPSLLHSNPPTFLTPPF